MFNKELSDKYIDKLSKCEEDFPDEECAHWQADLYLCDLLLQLGYGEVVREWNKIRKWYA